MADNYEKQWKRDKVAVIHKDDSPALKSWKLNHNKAVARRKRQRLEEMIEINRLKDQF
jgi:hypothetical protein